MKNLEVWARGLVSAAISGGAGAAGVIVVDPDHFNFNQGLHKLGLAFAWAAIIGVCMYLQKSPLPQD